MGSNFNNFKSSENIQIFYVKFSITDLDTLIMFLPATEYNLLLGRSILFLVKINEEILNYFCFVFPCMDLNKTMAYKLMYIPNDDAHN